MSFKAALGPCILSEPYRITSNPAVLAGKPAVRGLRISVSGILDLLAAGADRAGILADYPYLEDGDITAALEYASRAALPVIASEAKHSSRRYGSPPR